MPGIKKGVLSVCCVGYNHAPFIKFNIDALVKSNFRNLELIIVDDGSTDDSARILQEETKNLPFPVKLILQKNTGNIGLNFNQAWRQARGEFITFLSLDDALLPDALQKAVTALEQDSNLAFVVASTVTPINNQNTVIPHAVPALKLHSLSNPTLKDLLNLEYSDFGSFYIQGCFLRKEIIDAVNGFDEDMTGDDIVLRAKVFRYLQAHPSWQFCILREPLCCYRQHDGNIHHNSLRQIKIVTEYLERYWPNSADPEILINWTLGTLSQLSIDRFADLFSINLRASRLLQHPQIQAYIVKRICKERSLLGRLWSHIYKKTRQPHQRTVTLFSCITFRYTLADKPKEK